MRKGQDLTDFDKGLSSDSRQGGPKWGNGQSEVWLLLHFTSGIEGHRKKQKESEEETLEHVSHVGSSQEQFYDMGRVCCVWGKGTYSGKPRLWTWCSKIPTHKIHDYLPTTLGSYNP